MPTDLRLLRKAQRDMERALDERATLADTTAVQLARVAELEQSIADAQRRGDLRALESTRVQLDRAIEAREDAVGRLRDVNERFRDIELAIDRVDPCDADPEFPLLLLPVRLETRYTADGSALRVRIFPDDIHIDQHDTGLDDAEQAAWRTYWTAVWRASEDDAELAWKTLVATVGARRALWIATGVPPSNLAERTSATAPKFGEVPPRARRAAVARLLPDRFVAVVQQGASRKSATGKRIAPEVTVGLLSNDGTEMIDVNGVKIMPGMEWAINYDAAVAAGLGITVPLPVANGAVDSVFVMGVRRSLDATTTAREFERLLRAHRCTRGLGFVPVGTCTNNTERERAGFDARSTPARPSLEPAEAPDGSNAETLATAFGIGGSVFTEAEHGLLREQPLAEAANNAFWGATWGTFLDKLRTTSGKGATISDATVERARLMHRDAVRGRGPLPALRVGNQPYGILPVSALGEGQWVPDRGSAFQADVLGLVQRTRRKWSQALDAVPRVGVGPIDETLREILGLTPVSYGLRARTVLSNDVARAGLNLTNGSQETLDVETLIEELVMEEVILNASLTRRVGSLGTKSRPVSLPYAHEDDIAFMSALLAGTAPPAVTSIWQAMLQLSWQRANKEVEQSGGGRFSDVVKAASNLSVADRERVLATVGGADRLGSETLRQEAERLAPQVAGRVDAPSLVEYQPVEATRLGFATLALQSDLLEARETFAGLAVHGHVSALARRTALREAMTTLGTTTVDERRILLGETLDCASHRLDAWCTAIVEQRRRSARTAAPNGLAIGAYGWVEKIQRRDGRQPPGGFVMAPSLTHAATAGILRSGYLSHATAGTGAFAIDLTSARVRTAMQLIDGIRQGQPLGTLLGYRIEREMHEARLDRFVLTLRTIAPLTQGRLTDRGAPVEVSAIAALAASNVTDGIDLVEKYQATSGTWGKERVRKTLNDPPANNPYVDPASWQGLTAAEWTAMQRIIEDAAAACDAVADLLMAESVHQLVQGNMTRASAALDAAGAGDAPPPRPEVITTPVEGIPLTHRVLVVLDDSGDAGSTAWNLTRPRAAAEPRLEAWAGSRLGDPATIIVAAAADGDDPHTLATSGLCALDIVYDSGNRTLLEQRLRAAFGLAADAPLATDDDDLGPDGSRAIGDVIELASVLRALVVNAKPATPADLARPADPDTRLISGADLKQVRQRASLAHGGLGALASEMGALLSADAVSVEAVHVLLERMAAYGVVAPMVTGDQLALLAAAAQRESVRRVEDAGVLISKADKALALPEDAMTLARAREALIAAGVAIFGEGFWMIPALESPDDGDLWQLAFADSSVQVMPGRIRRFVADLASVREPLRRFSDALLLSDALGAAPALRVAQLAPLESVGADAWIGGGLDPAVPSPDVPITNIVIDAPPAYDPAQFTVALVIDQWTDVVSLRERRGEDENAPIDERATAGVTFNAKAPSARAPQAMLLAVSPNGERWTTDLVRQTLQDTLELAKLRLVTLERTIGAARVLPALYAQSWSLQGEQVLDFNVFADVTRPLSTYAAYIKE
ncbi:MAG: hypothetical protein V4617_20365 [Gemmatimonadota bacterium]